MDRHHGPVPQSFLHNMRAQAANCSRKRAAIGNHDSYPTEIVDVFEQTAIPTLMPTEFKVVANTTATA